VTACVADVPFPQSGIPGVGEDLVDAAAGHDVAAQEESHLPDYRMRMVDPKGADGDAEDTSWRNPYRRAARPPVARETVPAMGGPPRCQGPPRRHRQRDVPAG